jgi:hypothetical protein
VTEPDVALTDYGLAVQSGMFAWLVRRGGVSGDPLVRWFFLFFGTTAVAALAGGTVHGFFLDPTTMGARILWPAALLAVGGTALAAWGIGAHLEFSPETARRVAVVATLCFAAYSAVVFALPLFVVAVINYLPPAIFLLLVFSRAALRRRDSVVLLGAVGMVLTFVGAGVQQAAVGLHPRYFNHNALYHLIQGVSLALIFASAHRLQGRRPC